MLDSNGIKEILERAISSSTFRVETRIDGFAVSGFTDKTVILPIYIVNRNATTEIIISMAKGMVEAIKLKEASDFDITKHEFADFEIVDAIPSIGKSLVLNFTDSVMHVKLTKEDVMALACHFGLIKGVSDE